MGADSVLIPDLFEDSGETKQFSRRRIKGRKKKGIR
jgi:hypothetical protein